MSKKLLQPFGSLLMLLSLFALFGLHGFAQEQKNDPVVVVQPQREPNAAASESRRFETKGCGGG